MPKLSHVTYQYDLGQGFSEQETYDYVKLLKHRADSDYKVLFVLDYVPSEDLKTGRMLSGATGELFKELFKVSRKFYKASRDLMSFDWLVLNYNACRTVGKSQDYQENAEEAFKARLLNLISEYKPDTVVTFGRRPMMCLNHDKIQRAGKYSSGYLGTLIPTQITYNKKKLKFNHVPTLSLNTLVTAGKKGGADMYAAGYVCRNLVTAIDNKLRYKIPELKFRSVLIDSIKKFDQMLDVLSKHDDIAIDTETKNLNRVTNRLLTIQFAKCTDYAYVLPVYHRDSPFTPKELKYIKQQLRDYFETNTNKYHVFANAQFDLNILRAELGIRFFKADVWDIFGGSFCIDENAKVVGSITGDYYYSLGNLTLQYGSEAYVDAAFGKADRKNIENTDLDEDLVHYCSLDVIIPLWIKQLQLKQAKDIGHVKYESMVGQQISDMIHTFSTMEHNGVPTDVDWLFYLMTSDSPIRKELEKLRQELLASDGVAQANKILAKSKGVTSVGLFGTRQEQMFNLRDSKHKQLLFFKALGLKPLKEGKNGQGKIDKEFQKHYKDVPEVAMFTKMSGAKKLFDAYVKSLIKLWGSSSDFQLDRCIRPFFGYLLVVTGRTNAMKPNLQQVPSRSELGKNIKRLFVAREGRIFIKVDFNAHEVRGWSIISGDDKVAEQFKHGMDLRAQYKKKPCPELAKRIDLEGDVHKLNASYFFGVKINEVTKTIRDAVKGVVFGFIYQQGMEGLAKNTGQTVNDIKDLVARFKKRFPKGVAWFDKIKAHAQVHYYVESPLGRRRYLWGYLLPKSADRAESVHASMNRRAVNSPVQGMGSDFMMTGVREFERLKWEYYQQTAEYPYMKACATVHDSLLVEVEYQWFGLALRLIEEALTTRVEQVAYKRHGMKFSIPLEIEFEIGASEAYLKKWDYSYDSLGQCVDHCLEQQEKMGHKIQSLSKARKLMMDLKHMPRWLKQQVKNANQI